jgi:alanine-glyoxylate transaminase/(R)-3-amino-2-methylpropionate-pyruvate transaminase
MSWGDLLGWICVAGACEPCVWGAVVHCETAVGKATQPAYSSMFTSVSHLPGSDTEMLKNHLQFATGGKVAAFIAEPLQGYGGIFPLREGYLREAFELVNQHGGVTIADEVQTGFARCGEAFWGFDLPHNKALPDMVTIAKGMGNGVGIIGAVICKRSIAEAFTTKMWFNTFGSNPVAAAAARAVMRVIDEEHILANCKAQGDHFRARLTASCAKFPQALKEIRGSGLFLGLEVAGRTPAESGANAYEMHRRLRPLGIVLGRGSAAGNVFRIQPPMCIQRTDVDTVCDGIEFIAEQFIKEKGL